MRCRLRTNAKRTGMKSADSTTVKTVSTERRWMMRLRRQGGAALIVAMILPLASAALLIPQAYLLASVLHDAIVNGLARDALLRPILLIVGLIALRIVLGMGSERAGIVAAERIKLALRTALQISLLDQREAGRNGREAAAQA